MTAPVTKADVVRRQCHTAVQVIVAAWPHALVDADARGYPTGTGGPAGKGTVSDPTGRTAAQLMPDPAEMWLMQLIDLIHTWLNVEAGPFWLHYGADNRHVAHQIGVSWHRAVDRWCDRYPAHSRDLACWHRPVDALLEHANFARQHWPALPKKGERRDGVTVGEKGNDVDVCGWCHQTIGPDDPAKRLNNEPFHQNAGYGHPACFWQVWRSRRGPA